MDIRNLGNFQNMAAVWAAYPNGGVEGDYLYIPDQQGTKFYWDKYMSQWVTSELEPVSPARQNVTYSDLNVQNDLRVGGTIYAEQIKLPCKGLFTSATALNNAYGTPEVGMWAFVLDTVVDEETEEEVTVFKIYACTTAGTWTDTEETMAAVEAQQYLDALQSLIETWTYPKSVIDGKLDEVTTAQFNEIFD